MLISIIYRYKDLKLEYRMLNKNYNNKDEGQVILHRLKNQKLLMNLVVNYNKMIKILEIIYLIRKNLL